MNREIRFRGLNKKGEWVYGSLINNCHGIKHMPKQNTKTWIVTSAFGNGGWFNIIGRQYVLPETVGQFTGIKDKVGVDIYEGDQLKLQDGRVVTVSYCLNNAAFNFDLSEHVTCQEFGIYPETMEVIGNIHQK